MSDSASAALRGFIHALPKTETHLHIEGALPYELLHDRAPELYPLNPEWRGADYRFPSFPKFDETLLGHALPWFTDAQGYFEAARVIFAKEVDDNVRYMETSFHLPVTQFINVPGKEIVAAIRAAVPPGLEVRIFAGMLRTDYVGAMQRVIDDLENWDDLAGVDLHGFEQVPTESWTAPVWQRLRKAGKVTKCHAGEFDGANRVREAIEELGVTRVQHGVRAIEDPDVVKLAVDRNVTFDVCPISNVKLGVVSAMETHPLKALRAAGVRCTVSTDDPLVFANRVSDDYAAIVESGCVAREDLVDIARAGWEVAAVDDSIRIRMLHEIDRVKAAHLHG